MKAADIKLRTDLLRLCCLTLHLLIEIVLDIGMGKARNMRLLGVLLLFLHSTLRRWAVSAQPDYPAITAHARPVLALPLNITLPFPYGPPQTKILCFEAAQGRETTSIDGCRPTLNRLRRLPHYRLEQLFQERRYPTEPSKPPYIFNVKDSTCAIQLACGSTIIIDRFSFEQVRALATDIVEDCQTKGGYGGVAPLGAGVGWTVKVIGHKTADASQRIKPLRGELIS